MKNKKGLSKVLIILLAFELIIFFSLFAWAIVRNVNPEPKFTIYKEVCRNKTGTYDGYKCEDGTFHIGLYDTYLEVVTQEGVRCFKNNETWTEEICKPEIVVAGNVIEWCYFEDDCGKIKIGEESWGIEWIEKNCVKSYVKCGDLEKDKNNHYTCKKKKEAHGYSCGDYIVEVER